MYERGGGGAASEPGSSASVSRCWGSFVWQGWYSQHDDGAARRQECRRVPAGSRGPCAPPDAHVTGRETEQGGMCCVRREVVSKGEWCCLLERPIVWCSSSSESEMIGGFVWICNHRATLSRVCTPTIWSQRRIASEAIPYYHSMLGRLVCLERSMQAGTEPSHR